MGRRPPSTRYTSPLPRLLPPTYMPLSVCLPILVQVREAVEALQNEGHLYSTIDENHFKVRCTTGTGKGRGEETSMGCGWVGVALHGEGHPTVDG